MFHDIDRWRKYFAEAVRIAQEQDYLSDMDYFDMGLEDAVRNAPDEDCENAIYEAFENEKHDMFRQVFGEDWYNQFPFKSPYEEEDEDG